MKVSVARPGRPQYSLSFTGKTYTSAQYTGWGRAADLVEVVRDTDGLLTQSQIAGDRNAVFTDHGDDGAAVQGHRGPLRVSIWIRECMTGAVLTILVGLSEESVGHGEAGREVRVIHACASALRRPDDGAVSKGVIECSRDTSSLTNAMLTLNTDPTTMMRRRPGRRSPKPRGGYARPQTEPITRSSHLVYRDLHWPGPLGFRRVERSSINKKTLPRSCRSYRMRRDSSLPRGFRECTCFSASAHARYRLKTVLGQGQYERFEDLSKATAADLVRGSGFRRQVVMIVSDIRPRYHSR